MNEAAKEINFKNKLIGVHEASDVVGLSHHMIRQLCREGKIKAYLIRNKWRLSRDSLERYMYRHSNQGR